VVHRQVAGEGGLSNGWNGYGLLRALRNAQSVRAQPPPADSVNPVGGAYRIAGG